VISKHATRPWNAIAHTWRSSTSGSDVMSAMRSSSVAPFGVATLASQPIFPVARSNASSLPPAVPTKTPPRLIVPPA
jgi:hypothetical protein